MAAQGWLQRKWNFWPSKGKGGVFFFFFFWCFILLGFFGSQQDPWLLLCLFLALPKYGHIPLSWTLLHKKKNQIERWENMTLKKKRGIGPATKTTAQVIKEKETAWLKSAQQGGERLSSWIQGKRKKKRKNSLKNKKSRWKGFVFASEFFLCKHNISQSASCKVCLLCCYKHSSRNLSKAMPRSERGREKAATFCSLQNGWGPGESGYEQRGREVLPVLHRGGLGDSASISPSFPSPHSCPLSR